MFGDDIEKLLKENDSEEDGDEFDPEGFSSESLKQMIPTFTSKKLCAIIVSSRYFKLDASMQVLCMHELASRREKGDDFIFEEYIEQQFKSLPTLDFSLPSFMDVLAKYGNIAGGK
jgi:hypothetical protein